MLDELLIGVILAVLGALAWVAYEYPSRFIKMWWWLLGWVDYKHPQHFHQSWWGLLGGVALVFYALVVWCLTSIWATARNNPRLDWIWGLGLVFICIYLWFLQRHVTTWKQGKQDKHDQDSN